MERLETFNQYRSLLFAIAYRMLGSVSDAEDMVQEAWIRWQSTQTDVRSPKAFLSSLMTRLCIDQLRSARVQREKYIGVWLPEPLITEASSGVENTVELAESLSFAFLVLLECLSPTERAIFLLHEVFGYDYSEISKVVGKSIPNCRQIARRARQHLILRRPDLNPSPEQKADIVEQFLTSWNQGDLPGLMALMSEEITFWSDGGGQVVAARKPLQGALKVTRFLAAIRQSKLLPPFTTQMAQINGQPGLMNFVDGQLQSVFSFDFVGSDIRSIFAIVNPKKLKSVQFMLSSPVRIKEKISN